MSYLIAIDSDGTMRRDDGTISDRTKKIISILKENNNIVICTARPRYYALKINNLIGANNYLISSNGCEVYDNFNNKVIYGSYLDKNICRKIYNDSIEKDIRVMFVTENTEYVTKYTRNNYQLLLDDNNLEELLNKNIKQVLVIGNDKDKIEKYRNIILNKYKLKIVDTANINDEIWFSVIGNKSSKGVALKELAKNLKISKEKIIAIGNDENDISMFEVAGISVAVDNASNSIKKKVDIVTLSNNQDGVAVFLEKLLKNEL